MIIQLANNGTLEICGCIVFHFACQNDSLKWAFYIRSSVRDWREAVYLCKAGRFVIITGIKYFWAKVSDSWMWNKLWMTLLLEWWNRKHNFFFNILHSCKISLHILNILFVLHTILCCLSVDNSNCIAIL